MEQKDLEKSSATWRNNSLFWPHNQCLLKQRISKGVSTDKPSFCILIGCCRFSRGKLWLIKKLDIISMIHLERKIHDDFSCLVYRRKNINYISFWLYVAKNVLISFLSLPLSLFLLFQTLRKYGRLKERLLLAINSSQ